MRELKMIGAGLFALFAIGSLFSILGGGDPAPAAGAGSSYAAGFLVGRLFFVVLCAAIAAMLWRSANTRRPPRA